MSRRRNLAATVVPRVTTSRPAQIPRPRVAADGAAGGGQDRSWFRLVNHDDGTPELQIYDEIGFWGVWADEFVAELKGITAPQIRLRINSPGGEVFEGLTIYNALLDHPAEIHVIVDALAASAASFIAQAGDRVTMNRGAQMMIHDALGLCYGNAAEMETMRDLLDRVSSEIAGIYAARGGGELDAWRSRMRDETWMNGAEAVELGLADDVTETPPRRGTDSDDDSAGGDEPENRAARFDLSMYRYPGRVKAPAPEPVPLAAADPPASDGDDPDPADPDPADPVTGPEPPAGEPSTPAPEPAPEPSTSDPGGEGDAAAPSPPVPPVQLDPPPDEQLDQLPADDWAELVSALIADQPVSVDDMLATLRGE